MTRLGQRICVVGTSGAGKTFVAEALARKLSLRYVCIDALIWRANWEPMSREEQLIAFNEATRESGWVCDGNLGASAEDRLLLERCDTIVWLDLPRWQVHSAIAWRTFARVWTKEPLWHGNVEHWRTMFSLDSMIWWSIKTYARRRRAYATLLAGPDFADKVRLRLGSRREVDAWLASLG